MYCSNIQQTLDALVHAGLSIAVYEEDMISGDELSGNATKRSQKDRCLSQIISPSSPHYITPAFSLSSEGMPLKDSVPIIGLWELFNTICAVGHLNLMATIIKHFPRNHAGS